MKLVANLLVALNSASVAEALTMATRGGLDPGLVVDVLGTVRRPRGCSRSAAP